MSRIATEELRRIADAATPGPWKATSIAQGTDDWCIHAAKSPWQLAYLRDSKTAGFPTEANARLIALAPQLAAEVLQLREALRNMTDFALGKMDDPSRADEMRLFVEARALSPAPVMDAVKQGDA